MTSDLPRVSTYVDEKLKKKLECIAFYEDRTLSAHVRHILKKYMEEYEAKNGEIKVDEEDVEL